VDISPHGSETGLGVELNPIGGNGKILAADVDGFVSSQNSGVEVKNRLREFNENFPVLFIQRLQFEIGELDIAVVIFQSRIDGKKMYYL
jgi:hypothetical protein